MNEKTIQESIKRQKKEERHLDQVSMYEKEPLLSIRQTNFFERFMIKASGFGRGPAIIAAYNLEYLKMLEDL